MNAEKILEIIDEQKIPSREISVLAAIRKRAEGDECLVAISSYHYRFIQGKRAERVKRRKGGAAL